MRFNDIPHEVKHAGWNSIIFGNLLNAFIVNSHEMLWAIDAGKKIILANENYKDFVKQLTGDEVKIDDPVLPLHSDADMGQRWDFFYNRALKGEKFNIITNYISKEVPVLVDVSFIPIKSAGRVVGTACMARRSKVYNDYQLMSSGIGTD